MLSYRHAFHAGNHADVLKHTIELIILNYLTQKTTPFWYIDTHAGAGIYSLSEGYATLHDEYKDGIGRLWNNDGLPAALHSYREAVRTLNPNNTLVHYPGSAWLAHSVMPEQSKLKLFELHPTDSAYLQRCFIPYKRRVQVTLQDGFKGLNTLLPPPPRRALVLIDPPYEDKRDYRTVPYTIQRALQRFATGIYAIWYPMLQRYEAHQLPEMLKKMTPKSWLNVTLAVASPSSSGFGMHGSGMFIINPPWTLAHTLKETMPSLVHLLAQDDGATFTIDYQEY